MPQKQTNKGNVQKVKVQHWPVAPALADSPLWRTRCGSSRRYSEDQPGSLSRSWRNHPGGGATTSSRGVGLKPFTPTTSYFIRSPTWQLSPRENVHSPLCSRWWGTWAGFHLWLSSAERCWGAGGWRGNCLWKPFKPHHFHFFITYFSKQMVGDGLLYKLSKFITPWPWS